jgi:hypothetical protein
MIVVLLICSINYIYSVLDTTIRLHTAAVSLSPLSLVRPTKVERCATVVPSFSGFDGNLFLITATLSKRKGGYRKRRGNRGELGFVSALLLLFLCPD